MKKFFTLFIILISLPCTMSYGENEKRNTAIGISILIAGYGLYNWYTNNPENALEVQLTNNVSTTNTPSSDQITHTNHDESTKNSSQLLQELHQNIENMHKGVQDLRTATEEQKMELDKWNSISLTSEPQKTVNNKPTFLEIVKNIDILELLKNNPDY